MPVPFSVTVGADETVSALTYPSEASLRLETTVILAHGAGAPHTSPFMTHFARGLADRGLDVVTFNFLYMERRRRLPDPPARLESCYRAVVEATRERVTSATKQLVIGGKSMGGRIATQVVASASRKATDSGGLGVAGLVLLGYPLHPPGRPDRQRSAHLPSIQVPMLFVQGSNDVFGTVDEFRTVLATCPSAHLHIVEGGDHSFKIKSKGTLPADEAHERVQKETLDWIRKLAP